MRKVLYLFLHFGGAVGAAEVMYDVCRMQIVMNVFVMVMNVFVMVVMTVVV